LQLLNFK